MVTIQANKISNIFREYVEQYDRKVNIVNISIVFQVDMTMLVFMVL